MSIFDKLVQAIRKIPPNVKGTPLDRNQFLTEMGDEPHFVEYVSGDYKSVALELWKIIEDIEKAELVTTEYLALKSLIGELTAKRFVYIKQEEVKELEQYQLNKQIKSL